MTTVKKKKSKATKAQQNPKAVPPPPPSKPLPVVEISDEHPLKIGLHLLVKYRDGSGRLAKIIERSADKNTHKYYVHYIDFNRRMDEWITVDRILKYPSELQQVNEDNKAIALETIKEELKATLPSDPAIRPTTIQEQEHDEHEVSKTTFYT